jgi:tetratricopeptide (TPR) repeat protein
LGKRAEAETEWRAALKEQELLVAEHPQVPQYSVDLGSSYCNIGRLLSESVRPSDAIAWYDRATATLEKVRQRLGSDVTCRKFLCKSYWGRGDTFRRLEKHFEAVPDYDRALELDEGSMRAEIRLCRADCLLHIGKISEAGAEADDLAKSVSDGGSLYDVGCIYSLASHKTAEHAFKERYSTRAVTTLREAIAKGYKNIAHMKKDTDLDPLRGREDFKKLITELERSQQPAKP